MELNQDFDFSDFFSETIFPIVFQIFNLPKSNNWRKEVLNIFDWEDSVTFLIARYLNK